MMSSLATCDRFGARLLACEISTSCWQWTRRRVWWYGSMNRGVGGSHDFAVQQIASEPGAFSLSSRDCGRCDAVT